MESRISRSLQARDSAIIHEIPFVHSDPTTLTTTPHSSESLINNHAGTTTNTPTLEGQPLITYQDGQVPNYQSPRQGTEDEKHSDPLHIATGISQMGEILIPLVMQNAKLRSEIGQATIHPDKIQDNLREILTDELCQSFVGIMNSVKTQGQDMAVFRTTHETEIKPNGTGKDTENHFSNVAPMKPLPVNDRDTAQSYQNGRRSSLSNVPKAPRAMRLWEAKKASQSRSPSQKSNEEANRSDLKRNHSPNRRTSDMRRNQSDPYTSGHSQPGITIPMSAEFFEPPINVAEAQRQTDLTDNHHLPHLHESPFPDLDHRPDVDAMDQLEIPSQLNSSISREEDEDHQLVPEALPNDLSDAIKPSRNVPGLWFIKMGQEGSRVLEYEFEVDKETALRWGLFTRTQHPSRSSFGKPRLSLQLLCLPTHLVQSAYNTLTLSSATPEHIANTFSKIKIEWPEIGTLIIGVNSQGNQGKTWLPASMGPQSPALELASFIYEGTNLIRFIQLTGMIDKVFVLYAVESTNESFDKPSPGSWDLSNFNTSPNALKMRPAIVEVTIIP